MIEQRCKEKCALEPFIDGLVDELSIQLGERPVHPVIVLDIEFTDNTLHPPVVKSEKTDKHV